MTAENTEFPCFVADTSFMAAYLLNGLCADELNDCIKDVEYVLQNNGQFYVPALFWYEIENVLLVKTRDGEIRQRIFDLAEEHNLSYYDASYLELAHRYNLPLKTYDEELKKCSL